MFGKLPPSCPPTVRASCDSMTRVLLGSMEGGISVEHTFTPRCEVHIDAMHVNPPRATVVSANLDGTEVPIHLFHRGIDDLVDAPEELMREYMIELATLRYTIRIREGATLVMRFSEPVAVSLAGVK